MGLATLRPRGGEAQGAEAQEVEFQLEALSWGSFFLDAPSKTQPALFGGLCLLPLSQPSILCTSDFWCLVSRAGAKPTFTAVDLPDMVRFSSFENLLCQVDF